MTTTTETNIRDPKAPSIPVPANPTSVSETEKKKEQQAQAQAVLQDAKNKDPDWWNRNKDWLLPLIIILIAGAGGYALFKILSPESFSSVNTVLNNVDLDKNKKIGQPAENQTETNQQQQQQGTKNSTLSAAAQQPGATATTSTPNAATAKANNGGR